MSFLFPKPVLTKGTLTKSRSSSYFELDDKLMENPEPDYDLLLVRLSLYAFNRLSPSDQRDQVEEISHTVNVEDLQFLEESDDEAFRVETFAEIFKKLSFVDQLEVLSKVIQKFQRERQFGELISSFKQLDAEHQQHMIEKIVHGTPENLRNPVETEEQFRIRRFTQLSRDYTDHVYKRLVAWKSTEISEEQEVTSSGNENGSNWKSCFAEFFLGFSVIWFQGQSASGQNMLIEQLDEGTGGVVIEKRLQDESEEDFKLRRFTELCKNVVDFGVQKKFLKNAEQKLNTWERSCYFRLIGEPQDFDSAAELLCHLWTFGVSLLSAEHQQQEIEEMSNQVELDVETPAAAVAKGQMSTTDYHEEAVRIRRLTELFNQVPVPTRIDLFNKLRNTLLKAKHYSEAVRVFRGLDSKYQKEIIDTMESNANPAPVIVELGTTGSNANPAPVIVELGTMGSNAPPVIVEKIWGESEEDFRFRRFLKMYDSNWEYIQWPKACRLELHSASDPYDEFLFGVAVIWFKGKCADIQRNPIQLILFGEVESGLGDTIEKLPEESEGDFRLRRFKETFKQLEFTSQESVLDYIHNTTTTDPGYRSPKIGLAHEAPSEGRSSFDSEWINYKPTNPREQVAATPQGQAAGGAAPQGQAAGGAAVRQVHK